MCDRIHYLKWGKLRGVAIDGFLPYPDTVWRRLTPMPRKQKAEVLRQARAMRSYVEKNCFRDLKLADLSKDFGYSQGHHLGVGDNGVLMGAWRADNAV